MPDNDAHHHFAVNLGLYTTATEVTGVSEADTWYNTAEGRVKTQLDGGFVGIVGPHGGHPIIHDAADAWYSIQTDGTFNVTGTITQNRAYAYPLYPGRKCTLQGLAISIVSGVGAGVRPVLMALYDSDATTGLPGALVASYGTANGSEAPQILESWTVDTDLQPYPYWLVVAVQSALATTVVKMYGNSTMIPRLVATPTMATTDYQHNCLYTDTGFSGAAPATFGTPVSSDLGPHIFVNLTR